MRIYYRPFDNINYHRGSSLTGVRTFGAADGSSDSAEFETKNSISPRLSTATRSAQDALAMIRAADSSLAEIESIIMRMKSLALFAASDTSTYEDRLTAQKDVASLADDVSRIATTTKFNGHSLIDGSAVAVWSSDRVSTSAKIGGSIRRANGSSAQGNYRITIDLIAPGIAETQRAGAFRIKVPSGEGTEGPDGPGGSGTKPPVKDNVIAYNMPKGDFTLNVFEEAHGEGFGIEARTTALYSSGGYHVNKEYYMEGGARKARVSGIVADYYGNRAFEDSRHDYGFFIGYDSALDNRNMFQSGTIDTIDHDGQKMNVQLYFLVTESDEAANTVTFDVKAHGMTEWGENVEFDGMTLTATTDGLAAQELRNIGLVIGDGAFAIGADTAKRYEIGDSFVLSMAAGGNNVEGIMIMGDVDQTWEDAWVPSTPPMWGTSRQRFFGTVFALRHEAVSMRDEFEFRAFYLNTENGTLYDGNLVVRFGQTLFDEAELKPLIVDWGMGMIAPHPEYSYLEIAQFRSENIDEPTPDPDINEGTFDEIVLTDDTMLTVSLGSGESLNVRLYKDDTVGSIADKLNDAVRDLITSRGYDADSFDERFVEFIRDHTYDDVELEDGSKLLYGYFSFRTPLPGEDGRIVVAGPDDFIKNFDLAVDRAAEESRFEISIHDAHTSQTIAQRVRVTGSTAVGVIHDNVSVSFDPLADTIVTWNGDEERYVLSRADGSYSTIVHLADRDLAFASGDPTSLDAKFDVGDVSASTLGVDGLLLTTRRDAARAVSRIDSALSRIASLRARLTASESRMSSVATLAANAGENAHARIDSTTAENLLAVLRQQIVARAEEIVPAAATQKSARIAALASLSGRAA